MSSRSSKKGPGRREVATALENLCFSLALYAAGKGSTAEAYLQGELDKMANSILRSIEPDGMLQLQAALGALLEMEKQKNGDAGPVANVPPGAG